MNSKVKSTLMLMRGSSNQGFAMPVAVGIGLVMLLVAATMIVRSQDDTVVASVQKQTSGSLSIAETGLSRVQWLLDKYRFLALKNYTQSVPWSTYAIDPTTGVTCTANPTFSSDVAAFNSWQSVNGSTGRFRVVSYTYTATNSTTGAGSGVLVLEGETRTNNNTVTTSTSRLQVTIPVLRDIAPSFAPPGAWANQFSNSSNPSQPLGNNKFQTDTIIQSGCTATPLATNTNFVPATPGGTVQIINNPGYALPEAPSAPANAIVLPHINAGTTILPRSSDISTLPNGNGPNKEFIYRISSSNLGHSINLAGANDKVIADPRYQVVLYLDGNLITGGGFAGAGGGAAVTGVTLGHNCNDTSTPPDGLPDGATVVQIANVTPSRDCVPTDFQIYGGPNTTQVVVSGSNTVDAFILIPKAKVGVNGAAQIRGSVWGNEWNGSNANTTVIVQTYIWDKIPFYLWPPRISSIASWTRQSQ